MVDMTDVKLESTLGLLGDVHGTASFIHDSFSWFKKNGIHDVVQMGDFWFYDPRELIKLSRMAKRFEINFHFIDGNHENFAFLTKKTDEFRDEEGNPTPVILSEQVTYMPRGIRGTVGDKSFLAMGGAVSVDQIKRTAGKDWFPEENLTPQDVHVGTQGDPVDIMFTHDLPLECRSEHTVGKVFDEIVEANLVDYNVHMNAIYRYHQPDLLVHGHYHKFYTENVLNYSNKEHKVIGLGADISRRGSAVIINSDLELLKVRE